MKGFKGMSRHILIASFFALMLSLAATASYACKPGCSCDTPAAPGASGGGGSNPANSAGTQGGIMGAFERRADAKRVENKAQTRQHVTMNDNGPGMTCFDRALGLTQQLGNIFSDVGPGYVPPRSADIFIGGSTFPDMGLSNWLGEGLNTVVSPGLRAHVANFGDSLSAMLGAVFADYLNTFANTLLGPLIDGFNAIGGPISEIDSAMTQINGWYNTIAGILEALGGQMPAYIIGIMTTINLLWNNIQGMIASAMSMALGMINGIISNIQSAIDTMISTALSQFNIGGDCARIANLWQGGITGLPAMFRGLVGQAVELGAPYFTLYEMLNGAIGGAGPSLLEELGNASNVSIIQRARDDLMGILSGPGTLPSWPAPPTFTPGSTTADIISAM